MHDSMVRLKALVKLSQKTNKRRKPCETGRAMFVACSAKTDVLTDPSHPSTHTHTTKIRAYESHPTRAAVVCAHVLTLLTTTI